MKKNIAAVIVIVVATMIRNSHESLAGLAFEVVRVTRHFVTRFTDFCKDLDFFAALYTCRAAKHISQHEPSETDYLKNISNFTNWAACS